MDAEPNAAHHALTRLQQRQPYTTIITQNIDMLHQRAGAEVIELHGTLFANRCRNRQCEYKPEWYDTEPRTRPPHCPSCGYTALPAMTFFGEYVDRDLILKATAAANKCDLYIVVGSSGVVPPASMFAFDAWDKGARTVLINNQEWDSDMSHFSDILIGKCEEILPELVPE